MYLPQETPIIITGNKCDLPNRQIPLDEAEKYDKPGLIKHSFSI